MDERVLIVDDDAKLRELLTRYLSRFGFTPSSTGSPRDAIARVRRGEADLVLLDVMLPEMGGFDALRTIREISSVPVIMLTARGETSDRVLGLELGGDDYLPKPFDPRELVARAHAVLRRRTAPKPASGVLTAGPLELNMEAYTARLDGTPLELTSGEFILARLLAENAGNVVSRDKIASALGADGIGAFDRSVDVMVSRLRAKLGDDPVSPKFIRTVRGIGYLFLCKAEP